MKSSIILLNAFPDKKIKSLGNKYLLKINKCKYLIDYKINILNTLYNEPEIILVSGFDNTRLEKYISKNYKNIIYINHDFSSKYNIGKSILHAIGEVSGESCLLLNSSLVFNSHIKNIKFTDMSGIFVEKTDSPVGIGCILEDNIAVGCHYGLSNHLYDMLYIHKSDLNAFKKIITNYKYIEKLFLFEIINLCIDSNIRLKANFINNKTIHIIDNNFNIQSLKHV